jgi:hypothetical protein
LRNDIPVFITDNSHDVFLLCSHAVTTLRKKIQPRLFRHIRATPRGSRPSFAQNYDSRFAPSCRLKRDEYYQHPDTASANE